MPGATIKPHCSHWVTWTGLTCSEPPTPQLASVHIWSIFLQALRRSCLWSYLEANSPLVHLILTPLASARTASATVLSSFWISFPTSLDHSHQQTNNLHSYLPSLIKILWCHMPLWLIPHHFITLYSKILRKVDYKRCLQFLSSYSCSFSSLIQSGSWGH